MAKLILNSKGLNTIIGSNQIRNVLEGLCDKPIEDCTIYLVSFPEYEVDERIRGNCEKIVGLLPENIHFSGYNMPDYDFEPDIVYVTEGNTFEVLDYMRRYGITGYIRELLNRKSCVYIGSSAGAAIAGTDILLSKDFNSNFVRMYDFTALGLFEGAIIPHYTQSQLKEYLSLSEEHIRNRYRVIYSVSNDEAIIMDTESGDINTVVFEGSM